MRIKFCLNPQLLKLAVKNVCFSKLLPPSLHHNAMITLQNMLSVRSEMSTPVGVKMHAYTDLRLQCKT